MKCYLGVLLGCILSVNCYAADFTEVVQEPFMQKLSKGDQYVPITLAERCLGEKLKHTNGKILNEKVGYVSDGRIIAIGSIKDGAILASYQKENGVYVLKAFEFDNEDMNNSYGAIWEIYEDKSRPLDIVDCEVCGKSLLYHEITQGGKQRVYKGYLREDSKYFE